MNDKQTFDQYLQKKLSKEDYDTLHTKLNISKRRCTFIKSYPNKGNINEAVELAPLLGVTTKELIDQYGFGDLGVNAGDYKKIATDDKSKYNKSNLYTT